jgi:hypothetical protein
MQSQTQGPGPKLLANKVVVAGNSIVETVKHGRDACFPSVLATCDDESTFQRMSKIEEIEQALEQLPLTDFAKVAVWVEQRRQQLAVARSPISGAAVVGDHSAFLNSYAPQDEGLYDDAATR